MLVLQGVVASMRDGVPDSVPGAVWIDGDGLIAAVTRWIPNPLGSPLHLVSRPVG
jgi:hypothetical protein